MGAYYDEIEIEDMAWDEIKGVYHYPCPCGDRFEITRRQLAECEDIATCPSCSLIIRVIYDPLDFEDEPDEDDGTEPEESSDDSGDDASESNSDDDHFEDATDQLISESRTQDELSSTQGAEDDAKHAVGIRDNPSGDGKAQAQSAKLANSDTFDPH